jgi:hypothetical protein
MGAGEEWCTRRTLKIGHMRIKIMLEVCEFMFSMLSCKSESALRREGEVQARDTKPYVEVKRAYAHLPQRLQIGLDEPP